MPVACASAIGLLCATVVSAAIPELVGSVELLLTDKVAEQLELTASQREQLNVLADQRESDGIDEVMAARRLSAEEQSAKLAPYRAESERQALSILSDAQQATFSELVAASSNPLYGATAVVESTAAGEVPAGQGADESMAATEGPAQAAKDSDSADTGEASLAESQPAPHRAQAATVKPEPPVGDGKLSFNFRFQPWSDVLDWFADQADLSLVLDAPPSGTFNYRDSRRYTIGEALDVLNNVLQTKGYTLVRKGRMLLLVNLEDEIPPNLITDVPPNQLDEHGEHELVRVLFKVRSMPSEELAEELKEMVGPQGKILVLSKANMIQVTETAGRIRTIRSVIEELDGPTGGDIRELKLEHVLVDEVLPVIRQMLGIASDAYATPSGSLQLAIDPLGGKIFARGDAKEIARVEEVIQLVDVEGEGPGAALETPQLEVYSTGAADAELVLKVLQTLLAEAPGIRLAADPATGNLVALARPSDHATIRATLAQMQQDARQVKVIPMDAVDPTLAKLAVDKLFNPGGDEAPDPRAPIVQADLNSYSLIVRATPAQMKEIENLITQLGASSTNTFANGESGNIRVVPLTGSAARAALEQVELIWPTMRSNKIRIVTPSDSGGIREFRPTGDSAEDPPAGFFDEMNDLMRSLDQMTPPEPRREPLRESSPPPQDPSASHMVCSPFRLVAQQQPSGGSETMELRTPSGSTIIVAQGPGGILIASEDTDALDDFEDLLRTAGGQTTGTTRQFAVFYLKYADASVASEILAAVFGASGGGGDLMGDIAGAALNEMGGGMMGDLLGLGMGGGSASFASGAVDIVPDMRLNALIVYAAPRDLDTLEQLLRVIDQRTGPASVEAGGKPRMIQVVNSSASAISEVVKQVYADRLQGAGGGGGGQPSPRDLMRMLQRGGAGGGASQLDQEPSKMSIGVDARSNSVIVRAPDPLFEEVKRLVEQLDAEGMGQPQATRIVSLRHSNAESVKNTLESLLGPNAVTASTQNTPNASGQNNNNAQNNNRSNLDPGEIQRRVEFFRNLQRMREQGGGGGRGSRGGRGGRGGGGGGGRGGRG